MIRVVLPRHLRTLAHIEGEIVLDEGVSPTIASVIDAIEASYPMLRGTIRDHNSKKRRDFVRFFACERDLSHDSVDDPLPDSVAVGLEPLLIVGAMAGG